MEPLSFLGGALVGAGTWHAAQRLSRRRPRQEGLGDLLGWGFLVDEGVILMKDGTFLAGMRLRGRDLESTSVEEANRAARAAHDMLALLGEGYSVEVNVHRKELRDYQLPCKNHFPTEALRQVEAERREQFLAPGAHYESVNTVLISFAPPREAIRRWERLVVRGAEAKIDYRFLIGRFKEALGEVQAQLGTNFTIGPLPSGALLTECHRCLTGLDDVVAARPGYLSHALASSDFATGYVPRIAAQHVFVVTITSLGTHTRVAAGDFFNSLREEARWHMRFVTLTRAAAQGRIRKLQKRWFHQRGGLRALAAYEIKESMEDEDAVAMQHETARALADATSGKARFGYFTNTIILRDADADRGRARTTALLQTLRDQGFTCMLETVNATDGLIGSLPGHGYANLRRPLLSSRNVAHLFPVTTPWTGERHCPSTLFPTDSPPLLTARACGATPFCLNLHHGDVGHTLVVGATGAGKSVLTGVITLSFLRYEGSRAFVFDIGRSHQVLTAAAAGAHQDLGQSGVPALQPLRSLAEEGDRLWAVAWLEILFALSGIDLAPADRHDLTRAVGLVAERPSEQRTLTALYVCLPQHLQEALAPFTVRGAYGSLLDGVQRAPEAARLTTFELSGILPLGDPVVVPLLMVLFRQIERTLTGAPTLIVVEEAWAALLRSAFRSRLRQWLLTLRKHNAAVLLVAHSAAQLRALPNAALITESCPVRILLPNAEARIEEHAEVYRFLDLGQREIDLLATARRQRDYYYKSPSGSRLFELNLGPRARTLLMPLSGHTTQASRRTLLSLIERHGDSLFDHLNL